MSTRTDKAKKVYEALTGVPKICENCSGTTSMPVRHVKVEDWRSTRFGFYAVYACVGCGTKHKAWRLTHPGSYE